MKIDYYDNLLNKKGDISVADIRLEMQKIMQKHAGVFRNDKLLEEGVEKLNKLYKQFDQVSIDDKSGNLILNILNS